MLLLLIHCSQLVERKLKGGDKVFDEIIDFRHRVFLQNGKSLLLRGDEFVVTRFALLNTLYICRQLVRCLNIVVDCLVLLQKKRLIGRRSSSGKKPSSITQQFFYFLVGIFDSFVVILDRGWQIAREYLRGIVIQRDRCTAVGVYVPAVNIAAYDGKSVGNDGYHVAVLLNIFVEAVAHETPAPNVAHAGNKRKKALSHNVLHIFIIV
jgi:hypothetical protein